MASSDTTSPSTPSRSDKRSMVITLKLPSATLSRWPGLPASSLEDIEEKTKVSSSPSSSSTPLAPASSADHAPDASTPGTAAALAGTPAPPTPEVPRRKGIPGPKPGSKRGQPADGVPKPRGKPGPKKKPRLEDGSIDYAAAARLSITTSHKLGPRANQGAINAGLRALDRSGKPCRKWERKPFTLKSFTGVVWEIPTWAAPPRPKPVEPDAAKDDTAATNGDTETKANNSLSDKSNSGEAESTPPETNGFSSPAPAVAVTS
ncbi:hypothetical protein VTO42DRAFT_3665 [Malbranchea cinnamomea]